MAEGPEYSGAVNHTIPDAYQGKGQEFNFKHFFFCTEVYVHSEMVLSRTVLGILGWGGGGGGGIGVAKSKRNIPHAVRSLRRRCR